MLAARSGLLSREQVLDFFAIIAARQQAEKGREWRSVEDTTNDPIIANRPPIPWRNYQRSEDYYREGALIWLEVDTLLREKSAEKHSLDDFARAFFGMNDGSIGPLLYDFDEVVHTLNEIVPDDWTTFLKARVEQLRKDAPLEGFSRGGYRLVFAEAPNAYETAAKTQDFTHSLGFVLGKEGLISEVSWSGPAFQAGLAQGATLVAVNSEAYDPEKLKLAIKQAAASGAPPIDLLIKDGTRYRTVSIDYREGLRYPKLERAPDTRARLDEILSPRD